MYMYIMYVCVYMYNLCMCTYVYVCVCIYEYIYVSMYLGVCMCEQDIYFDVISCILSSIHGCFASIFCRFLHVCNIILILLYLQALRMEPVRFTKAPVTIYQTTRRHVPKNFDAITTATRNSNLASHKAC